MTFLNIPVQVTGISKRGKNRVREMGAEMILLRVLPKRFLVSSKDGEWWGWFRPDEATFEPIAKSDQ